MEEVELDVNSAQNSVYITAVNAEFCRAISLDSDSKNNSSESVVYEDSFKIVEESPSPNDLEVQVIEFAEQPPPDIPQPTVIFDEYLTSTAQGRHFEDLQLEDTIKDPIHPIFPEEEKKELKVTEPKIYVIEVPSKEIVEEKVKDSVLIKSTKLVKSGMFGIGNFYTYEIVSLVKGERFVVYRRFKDFEWLHTTLKQNYKGLSIPPLPNKTLKLLQDASEAEIRRFQLEKILNMLLKHSTLKKSQQLYTFLTNNNQEFGKMKESLRKPLKKFKYNDLEDAIDQIISKIQAKMNQIFHFRITPFNKDLLTIQRFVQTLEIPSYSLSMYFSNYLSHQEKSASFVQSMYFFHNPGFSKSMQMLKNATCENFRELKKIRQQLDMENLKIEALRGALNDYKMIFKKYSELEALIERKILKSFRNFEDSEKYLGEIQEIKKEIGELEEETVGVEANIKKEKIWFQADRDEKFESVIVGIFEANLKKACNEEEFWLNLKHDI